MPDPTRANIGLAQNWHKKNLLSRLGTYHEIGLQLAQGTGLEAPRRHHLEADKDYAVDLESDKHTYI